MDNSERPTVTTDPTPEAEKGAQAPLFIGLIVVAAVVGFFGYQRIQASDRRAQVAEMRAIQAEKRAAEAEKPNLPVTVEFRSALTGPGLVAMFESFGTEPLEVGATFSSPNTSAEQTRPLVLAPHQRFEVGYREGWPFAPGQRIWLTNSKYRLYEVTVPSSKE